MGTLLPGKGTVLYSTGIRL